ncbi:MAG: hypothetical protein HUU16_15420, partial [Candidatus Omnitrophica bacterium]|nr:hypothetical protein [Candidatus Omnitrophota bacterium]
MRHYSYLFVTALSLCWIDSGEGKIIRVAQSGDGTDGMTWETAFKKVSDGVNTAVDGDEVWVRGDHYHDHVRIVTASVTLLGGFAGVETDLERVTRDWMTNPTVIDAKGILNPEGKTYSALFVRKNAIVDGFRYTTGGESNGGSVIGVALELSNCSFEENSSAVSGGAFLIRDATASLTNCIIQKNRAASLGGGLFIERSTVTMENCVIEDNRAVQLAGGFKAGRLYEFVYRGKSGVVSGLGLAA